MKRILRIALVALGVTAVAANAQTANTIRQIVFDDSTYSWSAPSLGLPVSWRFIEKEPREHGNPELRVGPLRAQSRDVTVTPQPSPTRNPAGVASHQSAASAPDESFIGEVADGKTFEREIAHGLFFRLAATGDKVSGWNIEIVPKSGAPQDEFSWVATPPYHFENARYLDTSYATKAKDAVAFSPRTFNFVLTKSDYEVAADFVESIIYANTASKEDLKEKDREAAKVEVGTGELYVLDSRITPGESENETGKIAWIKFEVKLKFHSGRNMTEILDPAMRVSQ